MPAKPKSTGSKSAKSANASTKAPPLMATTLLAVTGMSPAILTETIWALAAETPRVLPQRVVVITTADGKAVIERALFAPSPAGGGKTIWENLRAQLKAKPDELQFETIRVIDAPDPVTGRMSPLADIRSPADNTAAANFILEQVRAIVEQPDTNLIASIAGGRKTMGALLYGAMTLLAREGDRLTHVLVSDPFDGPLDPPFYFPVPKATHRRIGRAGQKDQVVPAKAARIELADIPFVPLRNRFADLHDMPGSFSGMVQRYSRQMQTDAARPVDFHFDYRRKLVTVDGVSVKLRIKAMAVLHALMDLNAAGEIPPDQVAMVDAIAARRWLERADFIPLGVRPSAIDTDTIRHELGEIRKVLRDLGVSWNVPKRSLALPPFRLKSDP